MMFCLPPNLGLTLRMRKLRYRRLVFGPVSQVT